MRDAISNEKNYEVGQLWYAKEKGEGGAYEFHPVRIIGIYPYMILTETPTGIRRGFTKDCAFLSLFTEKEARYYLSQEKIGGSLCKD